MPTEVAAGTRPASRARGVDHRFGGKPVLTGIDLELAAGAITALVGVNGSGKTTLLRILAGILEPSRGEVEVLGIGRPASAGRRARRALCRRVSYVSQDPALDPEMTGGETMDLVAALHDLPRGRRRERVAELAARFGVETHLSRRVSAWSGGLRRRLHLALGMMPDSDLLLLDEPTAGLDPPGRQLLWAELSSRAAGGCAVAIVTHDLAAAERHASAVALLDGGALLAAGTPAHLRTASGAGDLAEAFRRRTGRDPGELLPRRKGES